MKLFRIRSLLLALAISLVAVSCKDKAAEAMKQVEQLQSEIKQIDSTKNQLETRMDSLSKDKENLVSELTKSKASGAEIAKRLAASNAALFTVKKQNAELLKQLDFWKNRADSLAKANEALKAQVAELTQRLTDAETRVAAAENRAVEADRKYQELLATMGKTYFVSKFDVIGVRGGDEDKKERIRTSAQQLKFMIVLGRPAGQAAAAETQVKVKVNYPDGSLFFDEGITVKNDNETYVLDVKGRKMDLRKGRYNIEVHDVKDNAKKFDGFFIVS